MDKTNITKEYTNGEITIVWQSAKCIHSGKCVGSMPEVFKPKEQPWIQMNTDSQKMKDTVHKCPSGAISIKN